MAFSLLSDSHEYKFIEEADFFRKAYSNTFNKKASIS